MTEKTYYHATPVDNEDSIDDSGVILPSIDGYVHLTTNLEKALYFMRMRGLDGASVWAADPDFLDESKIEPFYDGLASGDDCYIHNGELRGIDYVETYWFTSLDEYDTGK